MPRAAVTAMTWVPEINLRQFQANLAINGPELYVGTDGRRLIWAGSQQAMLVLGPPRSGKTSTLVVPNVLAAPGPVLVTSTKPDVLQATIAARSQLGRCWLLDPTGTIEPLPGASLIRWSPVHASISWEEALVTARVMTAAARPHGTYGDSAHWTERAEALLAPLFHASALAGAGIREVHTWVLRQDLHTAMAVLGTRGNDGADVAIDVLGGIAATEERERSGIFSTAASTLAAYRSARALQLAEGPNFDPAQLPVGSDTIYVCAPARYQTLMAPVVVAFLEQVRAATYRKAAEGRLRLPVTLVLDEVANVAPLPDLPAMVSEGGGQGLLTLACLQDLSQARARWGAAADGFFSLFGTKVLLPGIGDIRTLDAVSRLAGHGDVAVRSLNTSAWWAPRPSANMTYSSRRQPRLPVDQAHSLPAGAAIVISGARPPSVVHLTNWWDYPPFCQAGWARPAANFVPPPEVVGQDGPRRVPLPPSPPGGARPPRANPDELPVKWRGVPGQRRLHPPPPRV
ncbi:MAG TPA: type IV secretory system conjugative DNA transfer family protein [Acidimicrobiales bacterium]|nr:type IV secretory system conjugative DNA transfer family protein [Acidimicrobiales bacterium]